MVIRDREEDSGCSGAWQDVSLAEVLDTGASFINLGLHWLRDLSVIIVLACHFLVRGCSFGPASVLSRAILIASIM